jgi:hypothetical protein
METLHRTGFQVHDIHTGWMVGEEIILVKVRFGLIDRLFRSTQSSKSQVEAIGRIALVASRMMKMKRLLARLAALPLNATLKLMGATGMDMYVLAQRP